MLESDLCNLVRNEYNNLWRVHASLIWTRPRRILQKINTGNPLVAEQHYQFSEG